MRPRTRSSFLSKRTSKTVTRVPAGSSTTAALVAAGCSVTDTPVVRAHSSGNLAEQSKSSHECSVSMASLRGGVPSSPACNSQTAAARSPRIRSNSAAASGAAPPSTSPPVPGDVASNVPSRQSAVRSPKMCTRTPAVVRRASPSLRYIKSLLFLSAGAWTSVKRACTWPNKACRSINRDAASKAKLTHCAGPSSCLRSRMRFQIWPTSVCTSKVPFWTCRQSLK
mmetsp:Transcript_90795/g.256418  ORF Transcript_90795/g.256418 Transcript_90795/m.256418 type:complete len:225 (-) Transcript_90795:126-800(-)